MAQVRASHVAMRIEKAWRLSDGSDQEWERRAATGDAAAFACLIGIRFDDHATTATIYPLYVKNRDPRVNYQTKLLRGITARRILLRLARSSGAAGELLKIGDYNGSLILPRSSTTETPIRTGTNG